MKKLILILFTCFSIHGLMAQKDKAITANLTGFLFERPLFLEYETMLSNSFSLGLRANYLNYTREGTGTGMFSYMIEGNGVGAGLYFRYYFEQTGYINGFYIGLGTDLVFGNFDSSFTDGPSSGSTNSEAYIGGSLPVGYRIQAGSLLFDLSLAFGYNSIIEDWADTIIENSDDINTPGVYFFPALGIGVKF